MLTKKSRMRVLSVKELFNLATDLKSERGENPEYDRALVELCCGAAGYPMDFKTEVAMELGIKLK